MEGLFIYTGRRHQAFVAAGLALTLWLAAVPRVSSEPGTAQDLLEAIAMSCSSPESLAKFLHQKIRFQPDEQSFGLADYWQAPEEFLSRGKGDCEDYALFAQAILRQQGMEAFVFSLYGEEAYAHTVCVFKEGDFYSVINQDRVLRYRAQSLQELADMLCPQWTWGAVAEKAGHRGRAIRSIRKG